MPPLDPRTPPDPATPPSTPSPLRLAGDWLAATLLPQPCALCGGGAGLQAVCAACAAELPLQPEHSCPRCGEDSPGAAVCGACLRDPPAFDATAVAFRYQHPIDFLIQQFKFAGALHLGPWFADALLPRISPGCEAILAMPLHAGRLRERGYNQAREIARRLAQRAGLPLRDSLIRRVRDTAHQADLDADARRKNLRGAFACDGALALRSVLVVDDVMTTGTSLDELASTLKRAGVERVCCAVAARTPQR
jgi:ComF family protein